MEENVPGLGSPGRNWLGGLRKERSLSAREAVASQEAAEAAAAVAKQEEAEKNGSPESEEPVKMSLMDLLGDDSAYMPCAHTFCRLCSKELSVQRGSCPLCTAYVSEILHIF
ncbi:E3 ubiquitin-protein ligase DZIP3-like [Hibiscus syriacus]|uniref:E3 ubiquitin-protein ligase DZIP3-like n=1 Tax=Hibiscus syriacus TaxID=106335 RepID=UPI00192485E9|nr:E3 ubiquitin-protein ligase DZIP3-like [Hibiscus syriacus]